MGMFNGTSQYEAARHALDEQFDAFKAGVKKVIDKVVPDKRSKARALMMKATDMIKAHPYVSVGASVGLGYVVFRIARR